MTATDVDTKASSSSSAPVLVAVGEGFATVTLNRPDRLNAMNDELLTDVLRILEQLASDDSVRAVILTGNGRGFCAGGDLSAGPGGGIGGPDLTFHERTGLMRRYMETSRLLHTMPKVTIAAVNGPCAGAGLAWACACDVRVASQTAVFKTAFLSAGLSGDFGGTWTLSRITGPSKARELYLLNERVTAEEALRIGLVSRVVAPDALLGEASRLASTLAASAPLALAAIKDNMNDAERVSFTEGLDNEIRRHVFCMETEDSVEAANAFLEKREPRFKRR
ncbi:enoyl-CoA hydratase [Mycobacterium paraintracellulare]|uniref:enoyl-CoA hydratase n=1 Tax=Mycobacterium paraintracellulare TaxID=1138383 RepID=UPI001915594F|nr:enoyl-CoA hydratase [Mycobacterium paraintracellulare]